MKREFAEMLEKAIKAGPKTVAIACPHQESALKAARMAIDERLAYPILVGNERLIREIAQEYQVNLEGMKIVDVEDDGEACDETVRLVAEGKADFIMKGLIDTAVILKSYLKPEFGMRTSKHLSHVAVFDLAGYSRLLFVTDASMNIAPTLEQKKMIIENAVEVARAMGIKTPNVAALAAIEKVNPKMKETVEAYELQRMNEEGLIANAVVAGPLALDNAIFEKAAKVKKITHPVAGKADILMVPDIEIGNILYKAFGFLGNGNHAGVIVGGRKPISLTSRADDEYAKYNSLAMAIFLMEARDYY